MAYPNPYSYYNQYDPYAMMRQPQMPAQQIPVQQIPAQYPQQQVPAQTQQNGIIWVNGEKEAMSYPVMPNAAVSMWDMNLPAIYLKQADASGKPVLKVFDLVERTASPQAEKMPTEEFVTRKEFAELKAKIDGMSTMPKFEKGKM